MQEKQTNRVVVELDANKRHEREKERNVLRRK